MNSLFLSDRGKAPRKDPEMGRNQNGEKKKMNRTTSKLILILLIPILLTIPNGYSFPLENLQIVDNLPENLIAGNTYETVITFENKATTDLEPTIEVTVTGDVPIGFNEVMICIKLNSNELTCIETVAGYFVAEGTIPAKSQNTLNVMVSTVVNFMPGTYLFTINILGEEIKSKPIVIPTPTGNLKPIANAGPDQTVFVDDEVFFDGSESHDPDGLIMSWKWMFGDEATAAGEMVSHTFTESGIYTSTLTVEDNRGAKVSDICIIEVIERSLPPIPEPAVFVVSDLIINPTMVEPNDEVAISVLVTNIGEVSGTYDVIFDIEGQEVSHSVTLAGDESTLVEFVYVPETEGIYTVEVEELIGTFEVKISLKPAEFIVSLLAVTPSKILEGEEVTIIVTIKNVGEIAGTHTLIINIDDKPEGLPIQSLLEGGESKSITVMATRPLGSHSVKVDGLVDGFTVTAQVVKPFWEGLEVWILLILLLFVIAIYWWRRSRSQ